MKKLITMALVLLLVVSCKKEAVLDQEVKDVVNPTLRITAEVAQSTYEIPYDHYRNYTRPIQATQILEDGRIKVLHNIGNTNYTISGTNAVVSGSSSYTLPVAITEKTNGSFTIQLERSNTDNVNNTIRLDIIQ